jgi:hypothetical protein
MKKVQRMCELFEKIQHIKYMQTIENRSGSSIMKWGISRNKFPHINIKKLTIGTTLRIHSKLFMMNERNIPSDAIDILIHFNTLLTSSYLSNGLIRYISTTEWKTNNLINKYNLYALKEINLKKSQLQKHSHNISEKFFSSSKKSFLDLIESMLLLLLFNINKQNLEYPEDRFVKFYENLSINILKIAVEDAIVLE